MTAADSTNALSLGTCTFNDDYIYSNTLQIEYKVPIYLLASILADSMMRTRSREENLGQVSAAARLRVMLKFDAQQAFSEIILFDFE